MRKRTMTALKYTDFTQESHPALCALIDYAAQRPGLEIGNYGTWQSYRDEAAGITRQWQTICELVRAANHYNITDLQIIAASEWAYSGRMTWDGGEWDYCCGQYWPTEYRAAVIAVLRYSLPAHERMNNR